MPKKIKSENKEEFLKVFAKLTFYISILTMGEIKC